MRGTSDQVLLDGIAWAHISFGATDPGSEGNLLAIRQNADSVHVDVLVQGFCDLDQRRVLDRVVGLCHY